VGFRFLLVTAASVLTVRTPVAAAVIRSMSPT
jgi:hypothetical protein